MLDYTEKKKNLRERMSAYADQDVVVAFSGGVDSSLVLKLAVEAAKPKGSKVYAVTVHTRLHPMKDIAVSCRVAAEIGALHEVLSVDEMEIEGIRNNPPERCYLCKKHIFETLLGFAKRVGAAALLEGTNADDLGQYRPGIRALRELGVHSPLAQAGFTKAEVKKLAKELQISVENRPSAPCMATRFPYGERFDYEDIARLDEAEEKIRALGYRNVRLRKHQNIARLEVDAEDLVKISGERESIIAFVREAGFDYVCLDLEGFRSGSMDIGMPKEEIKEIKGRRKDGNSA